MSELQSNIDDLKDRIWITRKTRINASERCKKIDSVIFLLNVEYSIWLIIISILFLNNSANKNFSIISITTSIMCFAFTMLGYTLDYKGKYYSYKNCYIQLQTLHKKLNNISSDDPKAQDTYNEIFDNYTNILNTTDNQNQIDYINLILTDSWVREKAIKKGYEINKVKRDANKDRVVNAFVVILLALMPIIVPLIVKYIPLWFGKIC